MIKIDNINVKSKHGKIRNLKIKRKSKSRSPDSIYKRKNSNDSCRNSAKSVVKSVKKCVVGKPKTAFEVGLLDKVTSKSKNQASNWMSLSRTFRSKSKDTRNHSPKKQHRPMSKQIQKLAKIYLSLKLKSPKSGNKKRSKIVQKSSPKKSAQRSQNKRMST